MSQAWKQLEKWWSTALQKAGLPAERISRAGNWSESTYDVKIMGHPEYISDCKYSKAGFKVNRLHRETTEKYAKKGDKVIVVTRGYNEKPKAMVDAEFMAKLLAHWINNPPGQCSIPCSKGCGKPVVFKQIWHNDCKPLKTDFMGSKYGASG